MRVLIVFNHPHDGSYCSALLAAALDALDGAGHEIDLIHLDRDGFDPVMRSKDLRAFALARSDAEAALALLDERVRDYKVRLEQADHLVLIFPIWWEAMPALMKGFIDKVIFPGIAYDYVGGTTGMKTRLTRLGGVTMLTTMNTPRWAYRLIFGNAVAKAVIRGTFWKIGVPNRRWINLTEVKAATPHSRAAWLREVARSMQRLGR